MDRTPESNEKQHVLPFSNLEDSSEAEIPSETSQLEFPSMIKKSYRDLLTIEDEYEGLTSAEATTDVAQCTQSVRDKENELSNLNKKINQEKLKLEKLKGDLEEAEVCLSMAQSFEAAITGWRQTIESLESLYNSTIESQVPLSMAEEAWKDLKFVEQQTLMELESATTKDVIHAPFGSMSVQKSESLFPNEVSIEILGDYLPVSILTEEAQLSLKHCMQGNATYAVHCQSQC
ncbi:hypothetical protein [Gimesia aquarii]|uniref:Chromosome partition protein Smc n=1 Tax=Gimesia aquarii TaxID=2527964 RepID=A0A517WNN8_9PLAN|nr:hypothetical protein [Gimesia aquarii]QDU06853.1 hypothetical protein V202x_01960 [Gimesia aquarii]